MPVNSSLTYSKKVWYTTAPHPFSCWLACCTVRKFNFWFYHLLLIQFYWACLSPFTQSYVWLDWWTTYPLGIFLFLEMPSSCSSSCSYVPFFTRGSFWTFFTILWFCQSVFFFMNKRKRHFQIITPLTFCPSIGLIRLSLPSYITRGRGHIHLHSAELIEGLHQ